jgi:enoyl-CoA hydratase/carnithine racemase
VTVESADTTVTATFDVTHTVATLSFGTGARFNALGDADWRALEENILQLGTHRSVRTVILRGTGGVFCSGSDLREWDEGKLPHLSPSFDGIEAALQALEDLPVPTVAVVESVAAGAGCQLALACDLQLVTRTARIGMPIARLGLLVPPTFANRLALRIGPSRAKDLLYGGRLLTGQQAADIGLISTVVADDDIDTALAGLVSTWDRFSRASLQASKKAVDEGLRPLTAAGRQAPSGPAADPDEFRTRVQAFLQR